jgi:hypothetical protein
MQQDAEQPTRDRLSEARDRLSALKDMQAVLFEALACAAEAIAQTEDKSTGLHDNTAQGCGPVVSKVTDKTTERLSCAVPVSTSDQTRADHLDRIHVIPGVADVAADAGEANVAGRVRGVDQFAQRAGLLHPGVMLAAMRWMACAMPRGTPLMIMPGRLAPRGPVRGPRWCSRGWRPAGCA